MTEEEELKARIEAAKKDLSFFSLYWDDIQNTDWISDEELEEGINDVSEDIVENKALDVIDEGECTNEEPNLRIVERLTEGVL